MHNFISKSVLGKHIGQDDFFGDLMDWWSSLDPIYQYAIIGGAGLSVVVILLILFMPSAKPKVEEVKGLEELIRLKMLKELAE